MPPPMLSSTSFLTPIHTPQFLQSCHFGLRNCESKISKISDSQACSLFALLGWLKPGLLKGTAPLGAGSSPKPLPVPGDGPPFFSLLCPPSSISISPIISECPEWVWATHSCSISPCGSSVLPHTFQPLIPVTSTWNIPQPGPGPLSPSWQGHLNHPLCESAPFLMHFSPSLLSPVTTLHVHTVLVGSCSAFSHSNTPWGRGDSPVLFTALASAPRTAPGTQIPSVNMLHEWGAFWASSLETEIDNSSLSSLLGWRDSFILGQTGHFWVWTDQSVRKRLMHSRIHS